MKYYTIPPSSKMASYVRFFWVLESEACHEKPYVHRSMADGCCELLFHYKGRFNELLDNGETVSSFISGVDGPARKFSRFHIQEDFGIFGVYLYPFAITPLFGIPASAIVNQMPDLQTLLGQAGKDLEEKVMIAPDNAGRVRILAEFFERRMGGNKPVQPGVCAAIYEIVKTKGAISVEGLASRCFLSARQFERNFKASAGFSPKLYSRIIRFQAAMKEFDNNYKTLTDIAYSCGYYDQSHFIHDFKEFSGYHPKKYFSGNNEATTWRDV